MHCTCPLLGVERTSLELISRARSVIYREAVRDGAGVQGDPNRFRSKERASLRALSNCAFSGKGEVDATTHKARSRKRRSISFVACFECIPEKCQYFRIARGIFSQFHVQYRTWSIIVLLHASLLPSDCSGLEISKINEKAANDAEEKAYSLTMQFFALFGHFVHFRSSA